MATDPVPASSAEDVTQLRDRVNELVAANQRLTTELAQQRATEAALRAKELSFQLTVDSIPGMVHTMTAAGGVEFVNHQILEYFGKTIEELHDWQPLVHPDDRSRVVEGWLRSVETGEPYDVEHRVLAADGTYRWMHIRQAYDSFADAQRLSKTGSFIADVVGDVHNWSDETYRIFELDPKTSITSQRVRGIVHPDDVSTFDSVMARGMTGVDVTFAFRIVTGRGAVKHLRGVAHVREVVGGRPIFIGALQDVTESIVAEEALSKARSELAHVARVTTMNALTASIAHEVNQPLAGIITNAGTCLRMLAGDGPDIEGARETARRTIRDANRASDVITRLRALFTRKEFTLEPLDLNEAMREVIALSWSDLQRNRVVLQAELADDLPIVTGDRIQLQQVVLNLIRNASDAMVDVHDRPRQLLVKTAQDDGDQVRVTVRDVGVGLDSQGLDSLFDAFYTTKSGGMGIGLFVSRSIVERHHGRLWAQHNDGPGATFSFSIPRAPRPTPDSTRI